MERTVECPQVVGCIVCGISLGLSSLDVAILHYSYVGNGIFISKIIQFVWGINHPSFEILLFYVQIMIMFPMLVEQCCKVTRDCTAL